MIPCVLSSIRFGKQVARDMLLANKTYQSFWTQHMEGMVSTKNKFAMLGFIFGTVCEAELETETNDRNITVRFILSKPYATNEQIENNTWQTMEEFLEEANGKYQNHPVMNANLN